MVNYDDLIPIDHRSDHRSGATAGEQGLGQGQGLGPSSSSSSSSSLESPSEVITLSDHTRQTIAEVLQFAGVQGLDHSPGACAFTIPSTLYLHDRRSGRGTDGNGGNERESSVSTIDTTRVTTGRGGIGVGGDTSGSDRTLETGVVSADELSLRARLQLSQEMYRKLSVYFLPFSHRLMAVSTSSSSNGAITQSIPSTPPVTSADHTPSPSTVAVTNAIDVASPRLDANNHTDSHTDSHTISPSTTTTGESSSSTVPGNTLLPLTTDLITPLPPSSTSSGTISLTSNPPKTLTTPFFDVIRRHNNMVSFDMNTNTALSTSTIDTGTSTPQILDLSVNFTEWNHRLPPAHLPLFPYGRNHSLTTHLLWFENENSAYHSKSGFLAHLFPQVSELVNEGINPPWFYSFLYINPTTFTYYQCVVLLPR